MCGFAGIWWGGGEPPAAAPAAVARMLRTIGHRGPDETSWIHSPRGIVGFRRLAVIDPAAGHQPVASTDGMVQCLLNGEIYNHRELRRPFRRDGVRMSSDSDACVIPHLYRQHGDAFVHRLEGMFAICLVDHGRGRLVLWRDHFGVKPLYHAEVDGVLVFASELKAIVASGLVSPVIDRASLLATLDLLHVPGPWTMLDGVRELPPGGRLVVETGCAGPNDPAGRRIDPRIDRWYVPPAIPDSATGDGDREALRARLDASVDAQLVADVPVAIALSGGVDSTLIAEAAVRVRGGGAGLLAITCDGPGTPPDEIAHARATAARLGLEHRVVTERADALDRRLPELAWIADAPVTDPALLPAVRLAEAAATSATVLLLGCGGDEVFAGYPSAPVGRFERLWGRLPRSLRRVVIDRLSGGDPWRRARLEAMGETRQSRCAMHLLLRSILPPDERRRLAAAMSDGPGADRDPAEAVRRAFDAALGADLINQQAYADLTTYLPDQLLTMFDRATMAASIEGRVPLLDRRLVEAGLAIRGRAKLAGGRSKAVLRDLLDPAGGEALRRRGKRGFASPVQRWLGGDVGRTLRGLADHPESITRTILGRDGLEARLAATGGEGPGATARWRERGPLFTLAMVETWNRIFVVDRRVDRPAESIEDLVAGRRASLAETKPMGTTAGMPAGAAAAASGVDARPIAGPGAAA